MAKTKIEARQALEDIRAGMDDSSMMDKYRLSAKGLQSLFRKLVKAELISRDELSGRMVGFSGDVRLADVSPTTSRSRPQTRRKPKTTVRASEAVEDIRSGMDDASMMDKYKLTSEGLQNLFVKLINAGLISQWEVDHRMESFESTVDLMAIMKSLGLEKNLSTRGRRGPKKCPSCGALQTMEFDGCPVCGMDMAPQDPEPYGWKCPVCGQQQDKVPDRCPVCGAPAKR